MKVLHTADLHLKQGEKKRIDVLEWLVRKADELKTDAFIIAGDLFDSDTDATILRPVVKKIFESTSSKILLISGNHDERSYNQSYDYGNNVVQFVNKPFEFIEHRGLKICGIPYQNAKFSECIKDLPENIDILIGHGTLYDQSFIFSMLDDEETKYLPIYPANLEGLARYVALGHLHSRNIEKLYKNTKVVYPGSPVALDTKCLEKRVLYSIEIEKIKLSVNPIEIAISPCWIKKEFFIFPGIEERIIKEIEIYLTSCINKNIMPNIVISGFIGIKDRDFRNRVDQLREAYQNNFLDFKLDNRDVKSWDMVMQNHAVKKFVEKTEGLNEKLRMKIFEISFPIFNDILE